MSNVIVLGAGMVGSAMAIDLAKKHQVTLTDLSREVLNKTQAKCSDLNTLPLDVTQKRMLQDQITQHDLVINAVPGFLGFDTLRSIIEAGMNVIDIAFFPENSLELNALVVPAAALIAVEPPDGEGPAELVSPLGSGDAVVMIPPQQPM